MVHIFLTFLQKSTKPGRPDSFHKVTSLPIMISILQWISKESYHSTSQSVVMAYKF